MSRHQTRATALNAVFKTSTFTKPGVHYCVEVAIVDDTIAVRDSKNPDGGTLHFNRGEWNAFIKGVKAGEFNI